MSFSRYFSRQTKKNEETMYSDTFEIRDVEFINHYETAENKIDKSFSLSELEIEYYIWGSGDKIYKIAERAYGDPSLWWIICKFNKRPTESHIKEGDTILIPHQLEKTLKYLGM